MRRWGERDVPASLLRLQGGGVTLRVGLDDLGAGDLEDPGGGDLAEVGGQRGVDHPHGDLVELAAHGGDLPGEPRLQPQLLHGPPPRREPVAQVERVGHGPAGGVGVDPARDGELRQAQLLHLRGALPADLDQPVLPAPSPAHAPNPLRPGRRAR